MAWRVERLRSGAFTCVHDNGRREGLYWSRKLADRARMAKDRATVVRQKGRKRS